MSRYPMRTIALGPPFDDGTVPGKGRPADARGATPPSNGLRTADVSGKPGRPTALPNIVHPEDEKRALIRDIRARLPLVAIQYPDLAEAIAQAMDVVEAEAPAPKLIATEMAEMTSYLWGLVLSHHAGGRHRGSARDCQLSFCEVIKYAVRRQQSALVAAGYPDPMVQDFKPQHRPDAIVGDGRES